jgi:hypothetical protein
MVEWPYRFSIKVHMPIAAVIISKRVTLQPNKTCQLIILFTSEQQHALRVLSQQILIHLLTVHLFYEPTEYNRDDRQSVNSPQLTYINIRIIQHFPICSPHYWTYSATYQHCQWHSFTTFGLHKIWLQRKIYSIMWGRVAHSVLIFVTHKIVFVTETYQQ